jgi:hypothetical protein
MLWLAGVGDMTSKEIDRAWIKELARQDVHHLDVIEHPEDQSTEIIIWPNTKLSDASSD